MKKITAILIFTVAALLGASLVINNAYAKKPIPPLKITIGPVQTGLLPADIKPGDVVEFKVSAVSLSDISEANITIDLTGGTEMVSGDTQWKGPLLRNETKTVILTVRVPLHGKGKIKVRVTIPSAQGSPFATHAEYVLGGENKEKKPAREPEKKRDVKGRDIIEYR